MVNIPIGAKLRPFNFNVVGTLSHELFHQWNLYTVFPAAQNGSAVGEGAWLLTEGFTNYFAVAAMVKAGMIKMDDFAHFLDHYKNMLEHNPHYPGADFKAIQAGFSTDSSMNDLAYQKGPFVAVLMDIAIREDTGGKKSLAAWFRELEKRFASTQGYNINDLRKLVVDISGNANGNAVRTFDEAFMGGKALNLDSLFLKFGMECDLSEKCKLKKLSKESTVIRAKVFSARD